MICLGQLGFRVKAWIWDRIPEMLRIGVSGIFYVAKRQAFYLHAFLRASFLLKITSKESVFYSRKDFEKTEGIKAEEWYILSKNGNREKEVTKNCTDLPKSIWKKMHRNKAG